MLTLMVLILLGVHALVTFSNATLLGAATAPALAAAKGWRNLGVPGVPVGVFGCALGTFIGMLLFKCWTRLF